MPRVNFTDNLKRHLDCPSLNVTGNNLFEVLQQVFQENQQLRTYILDDQNRLRKHILISIDNQLVSDRIHLSDVVSQDSEVYILQALSGG